MTLLLQWWLGLVGSEHRQPDQQQASKRKVWGGVGKKGRDDQGGQAVKGVALAPKLAAGF